MEVEDGPYPTWQQTEYGLRGIMPVKRQFRYAVAVDTTKGGGLVLVTREGKTRPQGSIKIQEG